MNTESTDRSNDDFDEFANAAGAALRRPAPDGGVSGVRSARQRRRVAQIAAATGAVAIVVVVGAFVIGANRDDSRRLVTSDTTPTTVPAPTTSSSPPTTSDPVVVPGSLVELTPTTPMLWADGVLAAAWVDGGFVPASETTGLPAGMLGTPIELLDRTGDSSLWIPGTDDCGITRLRSTQTDLMFARGLLWSSDYPLTGTLDGGTETSNAVLDQALDDLGVDRASLDLRVPSVDLDGDPDEEVVIVRYDTNTAPTDDRSAVWLAVWDPATAAIDTLAGDAISNDVHFAVFADGIADLDSNGLYDAVVDDGDTVNLIELTTGAVLSSVNTSCANPGTEIELRADGIGTHLFGAAQSDVEATLTQALGPPDLADQLQPAPVFTCFRWGCSNSTVLHWPDAGLLVAFSERTADGDTLQDPVLEAWTLTPSATWRPGDIYVPDPDLSPGPFPTTRLALESGIGLGSTVAELQAALPSTVFARWNDSSFVPTGFHVTDPSGTPILVGDLDWDIVSELQSALVADGASLAVDGRAGPNTTAAFTAYRQRTGLNDPAAALESLGITGPGTETQLVRLSAGDWAWELSCGDLEPFGIPSEC